LNTGISSANFGFLASHNTHLVRLAGLAERYFQDDPETTLIKLRQFAELLAQIVAARIGLYVNQEEHLVDLLNRLEFGRVISREDGERFFRLRKAGNWAVHIRYLGATDAGAGDHAIALTHLKVARELGIWFHRTFGSDRKFSPGPFVPPPDPAAATTALHQELTRLREEVANHRTAAEKARLAVEETTQARLTAEERARQEAVERELWEQFAHEGEQAKQELMQQLAALQTQSAANPENTRALVQRAEETANAIDLLLMDEAGVECRTRLYTKKLEPNEKGIRRGVRLFEYLVKKANQGNAVGISYIGFLTYLHSCDEGKFSELAGRDFRQGDSSDAVCIASCVTVQAGGRKQIAGSGRSIQAGMDTFIWSKKSPHDRPRRAFENSRYPIPYTPEDWRLIFPDAQRRLITPAELGLVGREADHS
jgi:hypothetical protein